MDNGIAILDIILLAMIAGFIALRLRSVLGNKTGHEKDPEETGKKKLKESSHLKLVPDDNQGDEVFVSSPDPVSLNKLSKQSQDHLDTILALEPSFSIEQFIEGAAKAYPMILQSFWDGRMAEVEGFLSKDVYTQFNGAVTGREQDGLTLDNRLIEMSDEVLLEVEVDNRVASLTVKFVSDIVSITRDEAGDVVSGDETDAIVVTDIWTFTRELGSNDPNWLLTATRAG